jgi:uncharacterized membrane protein YhhN
MNPLAWVFLGLFVAISVVHLIFCFRENEKLRKISKVFCLLFLAIFAALAAPTHPFIFMGALLGCVGDAFLIRNKDKLFFVIGSLFFISGHICYAAQLITSLSFNIAWYWYLIIGGGLLILMFAMYPITGKSFGRIALIGNVYMPLLLLLAFLGVVLAMDHHPAWPGVLFAFGYVFFLISDTVLTIATFKKDYKRRDFYIMLTYLIAEFLIVFGLVGAAVLA